MWSSAVGGQFLIYTLNLNYTHTHHYFSASAAPPFMCIITMAAVVAQVMAKPRVNGQGPSARARLKPPKDISGGKTAGSNSSSSRLREILGL